MKREINGNYSQTIKKTASESTRTPEVNAQPSNRKEQALDNLIDKKINKIPGYEVVKEKLRRARKPIILLDEFEKTKGLTKIQGLLTSNLRTRTSTDVPYMAFLRLETADYKNHSLEECQAKKCKDCEIPVVFRIKETGLIFQDEDTRLEIKPNLSKGDRIILEGKWAKSNGDRPSFTCYSYEVLKGDSK